MCASQHVIHQSVTKLDHLMDASYKYIAPLNNKQVIHGINMLPGILSQIEIIASIKDNVACGLDTGNMEGLAKQKMRALGVLGTRLPLHLLSSSKAGLGRAMTTSASSADLGRTTAAATSMTKAVTALIVQSRLRSWRDADRTCWLSQRRSFGRRST